MKKNKTRALALVFGLFLFGGFGLYAETIKICDDVKVPPVLDPLKLFDDKSYNLLQQIFDCLVEFDNNGNLKPALALSWTQVDPLTLRFHLRPDVVFHNGEPFNADSVRLTIERHLDPDRKFPGVGFVSSIAKVNVIDPLTVDIVTHFPDSLLLRRLAGFVMMLPPDAYEQPSFGEHPIGTGPYVFNQQTENGTILLTKNSKYWENNPKSADFIEFHFIHPEKQVDALLSGEIDLITDLPGTFTYAVASNQNTKVIKRKTFYTVTGNFNTGRKPLNDVRVRRAINYAINKDDLIRYDVLGNGGIIAGLSMDGEIGHDSTLRPYDFNIEKAKLLLREAQVPLPIKLKTIVKAQGNRTAGILRENLAKVGIELEIENVSGGELVQKMASKDFDLGITGFSDILGHVFFPQSVLFYSKSPFSLISDPEYDEKLEAMVMELDMEKHVVLAKALDRYVHDQALSIFTYQQIRTFGASEFVDFQPTVVNRLYCKRIKIVRSGKTLGGNKDANVKY